MDPEGFTCNMDKPNGEYLTLLVKHIGLYSTRIVLLSVLLLSGIGLLLVNPQVVRFFIDTAQGGGLQSNLLQAALAFIGISILQRCLSLWSVYIAEGTGWLITNNLRSDLALHCLRLDMDFHKRKTPGELIDRIDGDLTSLSNFFSQFTVKLFGNALLVIGVLALLFRENFWLGVGLTVYVLITLNLLGLIQKRAAPIWVDARQAQAEQFGYLEERIGGAEDIRAAGAEEHTLNRLIHLMDDVNAKTRLAYMTGSVMKGATNLLSAAGLVFGLSLGIYLYAQGYATLGTAYLIVYYIDMLTAPIQNIREQAQDFQSAAASLGRVQELFTYRPKVDEPSSPAGLTAGAHAVCFDKVTFHYENEGDVIKEISFELGAGRTLGVLGRTGSGKTTLTRLLCRLYDPVDGAIRLDGVDIRQISLEELRGHVGMVTQDVQLFQGTVRDNLSFFQQNIDDLVIKQLLKDMQLWPWYEGLPHGMDSILSADGKELSAGQAQLLAFLRVFLKNPGVVVLDEASSRLDPATETLVERAIDRLFEGRTGIIIAHRLRSVQRADDLLILENGQVIEYGPRHSLTLDTKSRYSSLLKTGLEEALA
jgi:ABC-type multidrug transport system fused ATPase/permease subunit